MFMYVCPDKSKKKILFFYSEATGISRVYNWSHNTGQMPLGLTFSYPLQVQYAKQSLEFLGFIRQIT